ncbi:hypothetical protein Tco_1364525 [Tanacetum coccineum]
MEGEPKKCHWNYPRQFQETMQQGNDSYLLYRRRDNGIEVNVWNSVLDDRWVVPYKPKLLRMFNCRINVEVCSSIKSVTYAFKYVYKGHDKQVVNVDKDGEQVINEIKRFQDAHYLSPPELCGEFMASIYLISIRDVQKLWDDHYESLSKDYSLDCASVERVQNMVLTDISSILKSMGRSLSDFDLPYSNADGRFNIHLDAVVKYMKSALG